MSPFLTATLARAADYAAAQSHPEVTVEHLLLALTEDPEATVVLKTSNVDVGRVKSDVSGFIGRIEARRPDDAAGAAAISADLRRILEAAAAAAQQGRRREINGAIVLAAIVGDAKSDAAHMLRSQGLTFEEAIRALQRVSQAQAKAPGAAPAQPGASADDILATARERVHTRTMPGLAGRPAEAEAARTEPEAPERGGDFRTPYGIGPAEREGAESSERHLGPPASAAYLPAGPSELRVDADPVVAEAAEFEAVPGPIAGPARQPRPGPAPGSAPPQRRQQSWAPSPPRPAGASPGPGPRPPGGRIPPPLPANAGPIQVPGQIAQTFPAPAMGSMRGAATGGGRAAAGAAAQARVPWPEAIDPPAPSPPPGAPRSRPAGPRASISAGQLVHNIPPRMKVGVSLVCEARIGRNEVKAIVEGLQGGGAVVRHEVMVTKAMSVRLRAPDGGFFIEGSSPETQWIENVLGLPAEDFARWRWTITPRDRGRKRLQLIVSARTVGTDGLAAETAMPDQVIEVRVKANVVRSAKRWAGWAIAAAVGGVLARFGETIFDAGSGLFRMLGGGS